MYARAAKMYRKVDLSSASKPQILDKLYERLLRDLSDAKAAIGSRDIRAKAGAIDHAWRIVVELKAALDFGASNELCTNLMGLYEWVEDCLMRSNDNLVTGPLDEAAEVVVNLRDSFREAAEAVAANKQAAEQAK